MNDTRGMPSPSPGAYRQRRVAWSRRTAMSGDSHSDLDQKILDREGLRGGRPTRDKASPALRFIRWSEIAADQEKEWLIDNLIGVGETVCLYGPPGAGKSVLMGYLSSSIAMGRPVFGRDVRPGSWLCQNALPMRIDRLSRNRDRQGLCEYGLRWRVGLKGRCWPHCGSRPRLRWQQWRRSSIRPRGSPRSAFVCR